MGLSFSTTSPKKNNDYLQIRLSLVYASFTFSRNPIGIKMQIRHCNSGGDDSGSDHALSTDSYASLVSHSGTAMVGKRAL